MSQKILFLPINGKKYFDDLTSKIFIFFFVKVHESFNIVLESSGSYDSDANDQFWSTVLFKMVKNENLCKLKKKNFENFDFFLPKPNFSTVLVSEIENKNNKLIQIYPRNPNM